MDGRVSHREFFIAFAFPELPAHLCLGITIDGVIESYVALPKDSTERVNRNIPIKNRMPKFPENACVNGYVNEHFLRDRKTHV